eukprot:36170-Chlamydomonas_euryale.AAC.2
MDAVFHPRCISDEKVFEQEGWHYELDTPGGDMVRVGGGRGVWGGGVWSRAVGWAVVGLDGLGCGLIWNGSGEEGRGCVCGRGYR